MKTTRNILSSLAIAATMTLTSTAAMAHSEHDHSTVSYKWAMSKNFQAKIDSRLDSANPTSLIGLNPFEQKNWSITTSTLEINSIQKLAELTF